MADNIRYAVGYQLPDERDSTLELVQDYRRCVDEVYFAWLGHASGRSPVGTLEGLEMDEARDYMTDELKAIREMDVKLTLLCNANCYGAEAASKTLALRTQKHVEQMRQLFDIGAVTTASPYLAKVIKEAFPDLEIRASVNMRIGTVNAMRCLEEFYDSFYMQREFNRDMETIHRLRKWCDDNGKKLNMLVNSGCLSYCPYQTFHDNLVAHEAQIDRNDFNMSQSSYCRDWMKSKAHHADYLRATWVRPEDMHHYAGLFDSYKLATRISFSPRRIVAAYARGRHRGNLTDLTEPGYDFGNYIIDNSLFPEDWFERTSTCGRRCESCGYCQKVYEQVRVDITELEKKYQQ